MQGPTDCGRSSARIARAGHALACGLLRVDVQSAGRTPLRIGSGPASERRQVWCAGPTEPGNVFGMFFQTAIFTAIFFQAPVYE